MKRPPHVPQRTCVACRQGRPKAELLRIVRTPTGLIEVDPAGKAAGRGAYICRSEACAERAVKQKKLNRALGAPVGEDVLNTIRRLLG
jgi:predicted RNA-binding protein YlxR (DUF448 family)